MAHTLKTLFPDLLPRLERIMAREGWTRYHLGVRAFERPNLIFDIEAEKALTSVTVGKIYDFIEDYETMNGLPKMVQLRERIGVPRGIKQAQKTKLERSLRGKLLIDGAARPDIAR